METRMEIGSARRRGRISLRFRERLGRRAVIERETPNPPATRIGAAATALARACHIGLWIGLAEVGILFGLHATIASTAIGGFQLSEHFPWMLPLVQMAAFASLGVPLAILAALRVRAADRVAWVALGALSLASLLLLIEGLYPAATAILALGASVKLSGWFARATPAIDRGMRWGFPLGLASLAALGAACYDRTVLAEARAMARIDDAHKESLATGKIGLRKNVLLIVLDTVRADHLSLYGYDRATTPNLDRIARRGITFDRARSMAPWTFPSHAGMFTGRWPSELGLLDPVPLRNTHPTLAGYLAGRGYATSGIVANTYYCNSWFGLNRGFAHYEDDYESIRIISPAAAINTSALGRFVVRTFGLFPGAREGSSVVTKTGADINRSFLSWLDGRPAHLPYFAFLNYMDAHDPYVACHPDGQHFGATPETPEESRMIAAWHRQDRDAVSARRLALVRDAYDDAIRALDDHIGRLFAELEHRDMLDDTLIVITSDHGEGFGEHGLYLHARSVYREVTHVPLIILDPDRPATSAPLRVQRPVTLGDLAATIIERVGLSDGSPLPGYSLARFWAPGPWSPASPHEPPTVPDYPVLMQAATRSRVAPDANRPPANRGPLSGILVDGYAYNRDALGNEELYETASDPGETKNLAGEPERRDVLASCRATLDRLLRSGR